MKKDLFAHKSKSWDLKSRRVQNAKSIAKAIVENLPISNKMNLLDLGAGTGLLSFFLSQKVGKITALDNSASMLEVFLEKRDEFACQTKSIHADIMEFETSEKFDIIVSSMTIHHIENITKLMEKLYTLLNPNGFIALADLQKEDGSFHSDNTGVFHYGFDTKNLLDITQKAGFQNIKIHQASTIQKPHKDFEVFLLTAQKA